MKSFIELEIDVPQARVAALITDPRQNTKWMDDLDRVEAISGELGMPGSKYRLVPKKGKRVFVATVIARNLPSDSHLSLEASNVSIVEEFIGMILSQRAYEANSKVVKAADEMYQQVNNVTR